MLCSVSSDVSDSATLWTIAHQAPLSMGFSRQEYWSGLLYLSPGDLPDPGIELTFPVSCILGRFFTHWGTCEALSFLLSSVTHLFLTLCDPMKCSTPGFSVHHQFLELAQTHVHQVSDAIQPSYPLSSLSPVFSSIRVYSNDSALHIKWPKYWSFSFSISPSNEYSRLIFFRIGKPTIISIKKKKIKNTK